MQSEHFSNVTRTLEGVTTKVSALEKSEGRLTASLKTKSDECEKMMAENRELRTKLMEQTQRLNVQAWTAFQKKTEPKTLLLGSSLIRDIDSTKLVNTDVTCVRGGKIKDFVAKVEACDNNYDRTVLVLGGNDCHPDTEPNTVVDRYRELVHKVKTKSKSTTVSSICPRMLPENVKGTIDAVNAGLQGLCEDEDVSFVNNDPSFHLADGSINDGYIMKDGVHLTYNAVTKLARNLNLRPVDAEKGVLRRKTPVEQKRTNKDRVKPVIVEDDEEEIVDTDATFWKYANTKVRNEQPRAPQRRQDPYRQRYQRTGATDSQTSDHIACQNCGESNHNTKRCKYSYQLTCNECGCLGHKTKHHRE